VGKRKEIRNKEGQNYGMKEMKRDKKKGRTKDSFRKSRVYGIVECDAVKSGITHSFMELRPS
jgi:hypothetical protein